MARGKFYRAVIGDLDQEVDRVTKKVRKSVLLSIEYAININATERWETGFMTSNWHFTLDEYEPEEKRPSKAINYIPHASVHQSTFALNKWDIGKIGYIANNTEYVSFHDKGTNFASPVFFTTRIPLFLEGRLRRIK